MFSSMIFLLHRKLWNCISCLLLLIYLNKRLSSDIFIYYFHNQLCLFKGQLHQCRFTCIKADQCTTISHSQRSTHVCQEYAGENKDISSTKIAAAGAAALVRFHKIALLVFPHNWRDGLSGSRQTGPTVDQSENHTDDRLVCLVLRQYGALCCWRNHLFGHFDEFTQYGCRNVDQSYAVHRFSDVVLC